MTNEKLTAKRILAIIGLTVVGGLGLVALHFIIVSFSLLFTRNSTVSLILGLTVTLFPLLVGLTLQMTNEKLTVKRIPTIIGLTVVVGLVLFGPYYIIFFFSYPFTRSVTVSSILADTVLVPSLVGLMLIMRKKRGS